MADDRIAGEPTAVRVSTGSENHQQGQELLSVIHEYNTSVEVAEVGSTGYVGLEPLVLATFEERTAFFSHPTADHVETIVGDLDDGSLPTDDAVAVVEHDSDTGTLPTPEEGPFGVGSRRALGSCGWSVPASIEDYSVSRDAGLLAERAIDDPESLHEQVTTSDLRGRGRGDASSDMLVAKAWRTVHETTGDPIVVVNGNESDDYANGDRLLLESAPLEVLDTALATATVLDASDIVVYTNETWTIACERVQKAATALVDAVATDISIRVVTGPDEYKAGEPTMALEAIEGNHRLEARRQPPGPSEYGVNGRPTLIHTPRTFAQLNQILSADVDGASSDPGTRLFTVVADGNAPSTVELLTDTTLDAVLPAVETENGWTAACVGGVFGGVTSSLDVPASAPGLVGARLGTNGVVELLGDSTCMVALAGERAKFAREMNCGRCVPCREGSKQLVNLLRDVYDGEYKGGMLRELARVMRETSLCGFGRDASRPVTTAMDEFETEFTAHAKGNCPTGICNQS